MNRGFLLLFLFFMLLPVHLATAQNDLEEQILSPSAEDILRQLEDSNPTQLSYMDEGHLFLYFSPEDLTLKKSDNNLILNSIFYFLPESPSQRIKVLSYALGDNEHDARKISLERALLVRQFLIEQNIPARVIDVFPMGRQVSDKQQDMVEIYRD